MSEKSLDHQASKTGRSLRISQPPFADIAPSWLAAIIESADDAIISKTLDGIISSWNHGAERIFGYTEEEAIGRSIIMLIPDELKAEEKQILSRIKAGERIEHFETRRVRKDGSSVEISLSVSPILAADGKVIGASKIARDISDRRQSEAKLQAAMKERDRLLASEKQAREQAELASRAKDEFLGMLSHELRTPLNAILGWTRILSSSKLDAHAFAGALETIERNARLQSRLIEDMLDVSRIMSGKLRLDAQPVDLTAVVNGAVDTLRPAADAKEIRVHVVLDFGSGSVLGDPVRMQQVVWNLLSNAIKFTPKHGSVLVALERVDSHFELRVSDTGPGIDEDFLPFVFERFRQADSSNTKVYGGLGLGLAIVRQIVELHGGTAEAANQPEGGALFTVRLPVMATRHPAIALNDLVPILASLDSIAELEYPPELEGIKVLAVDDDADSRKLIAAMLERCGANVRTCASAAEALEAFDEFSPDVLLSDIGMPEENGYSLIRKIRNGNGNGPRVPAVALTAFARVEDRMKALAAGFNTHVPKPVEPAELLMVIASLVRRI